MSVQTFLRFISTFSFFLILTFCSRERFCSLFCGTCNYITNNKWQMTVNKWWTYIKAVWVTAWKVSKDAVFSGQNTEKYGPENTPRLHIFWPNFFTWIHAWQLTANILVLNFMCFITFDSCAIFGVWKQIGRRFWSTENRLKFCFDGCFSLCV